MRWLRVVLSLVACVIAGVLLTVGVAPAIAVVLRVLALIGAGFSVGGGAGAASSE
jgi:hypothetical protein